MTPILENAVLSTDLDCGNYSLRNIGLLDPVPDNLVALDDPRLTGGRIPASGSVTNDSVNAAAEIDQSKLNLNLNIPSDWTIGAVPPGDGVPRAAAGDAAELLSRKGAPNGYAALGSDGKLPVGHVAAGAAVGTVTSISIHFVVRPPVPPPMAVTPQQISSSGVFNFHWNNPASMSWFGSDGTLDTQHQSFCYPFFVTDKPFPIVNFPCSKFTSGKLKLARIPVAKPLGAGSAPGAVPDPGATGSGHMYLGRNLQWQHFLVNDPALAYQPKVPDVTIVLDWWDAHDPTTPDPGRSRHTSLFARS